MRTVTIDGAPIRLRRTVGGVMEIWGADDMDLARGLGFAHARDRLVQMCLLRLVGQGRLCECLRDDEQTLATDLFMRRLGLARRAQEDAADCSPEVLAFARAFAAGVNSGLPRHGLPLEFLLTGYRPEPWSVADSFLTLRVMSYGLAMSQQQMEKLVVHALRRGVALPRLQALFHPHLDDVDEPLVELIRRLTLDDTLDQAVDELSPLAPRALASNSWAVAPERSATGHALHCCDPHLECNRLPPVWYEAVLHTGDDYRIGITLPGVPGIVMGRTRALSMGFTYGFMDTVDYFLEDCAAGRYRRGEAFKPLRRREELIRRKKHAPQRAVMYETDAGTLECAAPTPGPKDGLYLCLAQVGQIASMAPALEALLRVPRARTVREAAAALRYVPLSCNWVLADRQGNIGYQQSGAAPRRRHGGLYPVPASDSRYAWDGLLSPETLRSIVNPPEGFIASANSDLDPPAGPRVINLAAGPYRVERIRSLLASRARHSSAQMKQMQADVYSGQAALFMEVLRPLIPDTPAGRLLRAWDLRYEPDSRAAVLFELFYSRLLREVFGMGLLGADLWDSQAAGTDLLANHFHLFDRCLLGQEQVWYGAEGRDVVWRRIIAAVLKETPLAAVAPWGRHQRVVLRNQVFSGKLGRLLGAGYGPVSIPGCRASIAQGSVFHVQGRLVALSQSHRYCTDLGTDQAETALPGGPSGNFWSRYYRCDLPRWRKHQYKTLAAEGPAPDADA